MENIIYEKLKEIAEAGNFTDAQIEAATKQQFAAAAGIDAERIPDGLFANAKDRLLRERDRAKWQAALDGLKDQLIGGSRVWLQTNFPNVEFAVDHRRKTVTIFFEGIPAGGQL
ncbi:MAG: hypothetical protein KAJ07_01025 [Planctomycetes bacterium]|nr:hypothetical protein [Planctomycetota bacterium]